jgi:lipid A 3-O-deacylase
MRKMRTAAFGLLCALLASLAAASGVLGDQVPQGGLIYELKIGAQLHDFPLAGSNKEPLGVDLNLEAVFGPSLAILFGTVRPALGATINFAGYTSKAYLDARWQVECCWGGFFALGIGAAIHNGELDSLRNWMSLTPAALQSALATSENHKQLGSQVLFHPTVEWGYRLNEHNNLSVFWEHISNAGLAAKNEGLDTLGIRYGYRF